MLGKFGHEAVLASNTIDGIAAAESGSIDVALIDMNMPGLDGLEAVKAIARLEPRIPVIGMSGGSTTTSAEDYAVLAVNFGAALFLPKPFDGKVLQGAIAAVSASRPAPVTQSSALRSSARGVASRAGGRDAAGVSAPSCRGAALAHGRS